MASRTGSVVVKAREPRRKVLIKARMRVGASWSDACILNLSSRGMLVQSGMVPERGNYLEIRRGPHVVVARVVWSREQRFGVRTQDTVSAEELLNADDHGPETSAPSPPIGERRAAPRPAVGRHERSRMRGRRLEFATLAIFGAASAMLLLATVGELLNRPLLAIERALAATRGG